MGRARRDKSPFTEGAPAPPRDDAAPDLLSWIIIGMLCALALAVVLLARGR